MDTPTSKVRSLSRTNRFSFTCPIFETEVELRGCARLHELHQVAKGPETRRGCQAAMSSSKCPIWHMHQMIRQGRDEWASEEPKSGTLGNDLLGRIARIQTLEKTINEYQVPAREAELLTAANSMWEKGAPAKASKPRAPRAVEAAPAPVKAGKTSSKEERAKAAKAGDLAAAINEAAAA